MIKLFDNIRRYYLQYKMIRIRSGWKKAKYLKKHKIFHYMGDKCYYHSTLLPAEPFLVSFHDNVIVSAGVRLITHSIDNIMLNTAENTDKYLCRYGKIEICDNVYIGANAVVCPGVTIGKNCVIAAGAVVTKDVPEGSVVAGVPAKYIESFEDLKKKNEKWSSKFPNKKERTVMEMLKYNPVDFLK